MINIRRSSAFGDVLWTEPVVRYFLENNKRVKIITDFPEAFYNYPDSNLFFGKKLKNIDKGISSFKKKIGLKGYVIDLNKAYERRPKMHVLEAYFEQAGIKDTPLTYPRLYLTEDEKKNKFNKPYVVLHIEKNRLNYRSIYGVNWAGVVKFITEQGIEVIQLSTTGEDIYGKWVKTASFRDVMSVIYNSKIFIGADAGPSHIAASLAIPSLIFFGAINPKYRHLQSFNGSFLQQPCEFAGCYHEVVSLEGQVCRLVGSAGIPKCSLHTTEMVIERINALLSSK